MASGTKALSLVPLSAERPLWTSVASHLVPQDSSTSGEALLSSRSVESDFFRSGFDCSDGKTLYPLLLSDSPTRALTGDLPDHKSLGLEDDLYLLTHSFPPPAPPGMQKSLSGRFLSYQQTEADTYHKIKATLWEKQSTAKYMEPGDDTAGKDEYMRARISRSGIEDLGDSCEEQLSQVPWVSYKDHILSPKRLTNLLEARSGKENVESQPQHRSSLETKQRAAKPLAALSPSSKPLRFPRPEGIQGVLSRAYGRQREELQSSPKPDLPSNARKGESPSADPLAQGRRAPILSHSEAAREGKSQLSIDHLIEHHADPDNKPFVGIAGSTDFKACAPDPAASSSALSWSLDTVGSLPQAKSDMATALDAIGTPTFRVIKGPQDSFVEAINALYSKRSAQDVLLLAADAGTEESSHSLEEYPAEDLYLLRPVGEGLIGARNALFEPSHPEEAAALGLTPLKGIRVHAAASVVAPPEAGIKPSSAPKASRPSLHADVAEEAGRQVTEWGRNNILFLDSSDGVQSEGQRSEKGRAAKALWRDENPMFDLPGVHTTTQQATGLSAVVNEAETPARKEQTLCPWSGGSYVGADLSSLSSVNSLDGRYSADSYGVEHAASELSRIGPGSTSVTPSYFSTMHSIVGTSSRSSQQESEGSTDGVNSVKDAHPFGPATPRSLSAISPSTSVKGSEAAASPSSADAEIADSEATPSSPIATTASSCGRAEIPEAREGIKPAHLLRNSAASVQGLPSAAGDDLIRSVSATTLQQDFSSYDSKYPDQDQATQGPSLSALDVLDPAHQGSVTSITIACNQGRNASVVPQGLAETAQPAKGGKKPKEKKQKRSFVKKFFGGLACLAPTTLESNGDITQKRHGTKEAGR